MTESEARTKPISEVWEHFKSADENYPRTKHIRDRLRAVLLERCRVLYCTNSRGSTVPTESGNIAFNVLTNDIAPKYIELEMYSQTNVMHLSRNQLGELVAALSFWAWELKQRQNESNGR